MGSADWPPGGHWTRPQSCYFHRLTRRYAHLWNGYLYFHVAECADQTCSPTVATPCACPISFWDTFSLFPFLAGRLTVVYVFFLLNKCRMFRVDVVGTCVHVQYARNGQVRVAKVDANGSWRVSLIRPERSAEKAEPPPATTVGRITSFSCSPPVALFKSR